MNFLISILVLLAVAYTISAMPRYLVIPSDNDEFIELSPHFAFKPSLVRVARHVEAFVPVDLAMVQAEEIEPVPRIERAAAHVLDYVDFGGHTGEDGAFGWYADFPAHT